MFFISSHPTVWMWVWQYYYKLLVCTATCYFVLKVHECLKFQLWSLQRYFNPTVRFKYIWVILPISKTEMVHVSLHSENTTEISKDFDCIYRETQHWLNSSIAVYLVEFGKKWKHLSLSLRRTSLASNWCKISTASWPPQCCISHLS